MSANYCWVLLGVTNKVIVEKLSFPCLKDLIFITMTSKALMLKKMYRPLEFNTQIAQVEFWLALRIWAWNYALLCKLQLIKLLVFVVQLAVESNSKA